ncbi:hypothetical protein ABK040_000509 [Willaertia magna]
MRLFVLFFNSNCNFIFADSLTVGGVFCNATKKFLTSVNYVKEKTKLLEKDANFYSNTNKIAVSNNTAEKLFSLTSAEKSSINNAFHMWTSYQLDTIDHIRLLSHSAMEMIKVENKIQNNKTVTLIQTALVNRADAPPYIPYLNGESNENVVFGVLDLKRGSSYNIIPTPLVALLRSQRTILCDLSESEWSTLNTTLIKDRITSRSNGKQVLKAGFMVGSINLNAFFSKTTKVVPSNSFLRKIMTTQPLSQVIDGCLSGTYEPIWYKGKTLYYTDFSTNAETFYVVVEEQIQDVIYRGFYTIVVGLFVFFMFVTFTIVLFIFQRDKIENLLISSTNLRKAMEENGKEQMEFRDMYEMAYFSLVPESLIMKNPKGLDNYCEHVKETEETEDFEDDEDENHCFAVIPFPKISIAIHIGDSNFAVIDQGIPCWKTFGKTFNRLQGMLNQEVICKRESQSMDYNNNCLLLSDAMFSKIQIISSIMNDRVNLIQNERKENCKLEQKVLKLINPSFQKLESPRNLELERIVLNNKKDFMFHRLLINQTKKVFDEILQVDSNFFFQTFIPKEVMTDLIPKIERNN